MSSEDIIEFWFREANPENWFARNEVFDQTVRRRFSEVHAAAARCELENWRRSAEGRLAEVIVLDQFSRNLFRDSALAFACDSLALALAQEAVRTGADWGMTSAQKAFLYMPYMHSESQLIHEQAVRLFSQSGLEYNLEFELKHKAIIDRFGRYPHRNALLERESTSEELLFLTQPESSF